MIPDNNIEDPIDENAIVIESSTPMDIDSRLDRIEEKLDKIHTVLDLAFTRFEAMSKSPMLSTLFSAMTGKEKAKK